ncbi:MAG: hypothetical protein WA919_29345 [Coleofasciculaceae cyanobacterium]
MNTTYSSSLLSFLTVGLFYQLPLLVGLPAQAQLGLQISSSTLSEPIIVKENFEPPGEGSPKDAADAGSRSRSRQKCSQNEHW